MNRIKLFLWLIVYFLGGLTKTAEASCPEPAAHFCNVCVDGTMVANTGIINNQLIINGTAPSFGCNQGALIVAGGVGIIGNLNVCGAITATGGFSITGPFVFINDTQSTNCTNGAVAIPNGGMGIGGNLNVCGTGTFFGPVIIANTGSGSGCTGGNAGLQVEGDQTIDGDLGVGGDVNICGQTTIGGARNISLLNNELRAIASCSGLATGCTGNQQLVVFGDEGISGDLQVCGDITSNNLNVCDTATINNLVVDGSIEGADLGIINITTSDSPFVLSPFNYLIADVSAGPITVNLVSNELPNKTFVIKKVDPNITNNTLTIVPPGGFTVNGSSSITLDLPSQSVYLVQNGSDYTLVTNDNAALIPQVPLRITTDNLYVSPTITSSAELAAALQEFARNGIAPIFIPIASGTYAITQAMINNLMKCININLVAVDSSPLLGNGNAYLGNSFMNGLSLALPISSTISGVVTLTVNAPGDNITVTTSVGTPNFTPYIGYTARFWNDSFTFSDLTITSVSGGGNTIHFSGPVPSITNVGTGFFIRPSVRFTFASNINFAATSTPATNAITVPSFNFLGIEFASSAVGTMRTFSFISAGFYRFSRNCSCTDIQIALSSLTKNTLNLTGSLSHNAAIDASIITGGGSNVILLGATLLKPGGTASCLDVFSSSIFADNSNSTSYILYGGSSNGIRLINSQISPTNTTTAAATPRLSIINPLTSVVVGSNGLGLFNSIAGNLINTSINKFSVGLRANSSVIPAPGQRPTFTACTTNIVIEPALPAIAVPNNANAAIAGIQINEQYTQIGSDPAITYTRTS